MGYFREIAGRKFDGVASDFMGPVGGISFHHRKI
jgi:hypothetical protein